MSDPSEVTRLLQAVGDGDPEALGRLLPLVHHELRRLARGQLRRERAGHTLHTDALVNEAYLKLVGDSPVAWEGRGHFLGVAARAMRQVLVDHARRKGAGKRGGDWQRTTLDEGGLPVDLPPEEILALDEALDRLDAVDPRARQVVELRFFAGLEEEEIAGLLAVTTRTVQRDWAKARAWLHKELYPGHG